MAGAEMPPRALSPGPYEPVIQARADRRTCQRNHAPRPLFHHLTAGLHGDPANHAGHELVHHFLFDQLAADVNSRRARRGNPQLGNFIVGVEFETVEQTQLLNGAHRDRRQHPQIRHNGQQSAQPESSALNRGHPHSAADDRIRHDVEFTNLQREHSMIAADRHPIRGSQLPQELRRIHSHRRICARQSFDQRLLRSFPQPRFPLIRHFFHLTAHHGRTPSGEPCSRALDQAANRGKGAEQ